MGGGRTSKGDRQPSVGGTFRERSAVPEAHTPEDELATYQSELRSTLEGDVDPNATVADEELRKLHDVSDATFVELVSSEEQTIAELSDEPAGHRTIDASPVVLSSDQTLLRDVDEHGFHTLPEAPEAPHHDVGDHSDKAVEAPAAHFSPNDDFASKSTIAGEAVVPEEAANTVNIHSDSAAGPTSETLVSDHRDGPEVHVSHQSRDAVKPREEAGEAITIGRFQIKMKLGEGAFGTVYLGYDKQLDRQVAIKVAKTGVLWGRSDVDRFLREARAAAHLRHPHIVPVYEVGTHRHNNFLAYEFIEGETLAKRIKRENRLSPAESATMAKKLAEALHYAHVHGIVHRDMKPDNVLLDKAGEPHIADFGLARKEDDVARTRDGLLMGTPLYMSPEQAAGRGNTADGRSDVWSLGVMLEEMLTGSRPFRGNLTQILQAIQTEEPAPLRKIDKSLPKDLETIVQKCLSKDVEGRYESAQRLAEELDRFLRGEPILARPIGVWERTARWAKRNPVVAGLIGAVFLTLLLGMAVSTYFAIQARQQAAVADQRQRERAIAQLGALRTAVPESLLVLLDGLKPQRDDIRSSLNQLLVTSARGQQGQRRLRLAAAVLFPDDLRTTQLLRELEADLLSMSGPELIAMTTALAPFHDTITQALWRRLDKGQMRDTEQFRALCVLAMLDPESKRWETSAESLVRGLLAQNILEVGNWLPAVVPVRVHLREQLRRQFAEGEASETRRVSGVAIARLYHDQPEWLIDRVIEADPEQLAPLTSALREIRVRALPILRIKLTAAVASRETATLSQGEAKRAANLATVLVGIGAGDVGWSVLERTSDRSARTEMVQSAAEAGLSIEKLISDLQTKVDPAVLSGQILILGAFPPSQLDARTRERLLVFLEQVLRSHPDAGVHGAAEWLLRRWGDHEVVSLVRAECRTPHPIAGQNWHIDPAGTTFLVVDGPVEFDMGASPDDPAIETNPTILLIEQQHRRRIPRSFGIAQTEVTVGEFLRFRDDHFYDSRYTTVPDGPMIQVNWYDAAKYCRWLSEQAGFSEDQMCFPPVDEIGPGMKLPDNLLDRPGYRLPTAAEWEYAARAGTRTRRPFGNSNDHVADYVWFNLNSEGHAWPEFQLPPNDWGLFCMQGNVLEWCQDWYFDEWPPPTTAVDGLQPVVVDGTDSRSGFYKELRGGEIRLGVEDIRVSDRDFDTPEPNSFYIGFRLARTYPARNGREVTQRVPK